MAQRHIAVIGGGPAGLMAAERLVAAGMQVTVFDAMPSVARKFLLAGKSGLNLTHIENQVGFCAHFGDAEGRMRPALDGFSNSDVRSWAWDLGQKTFVGSSGRVFPEAMKASPLLRAWLQRLGAAGVALRTRHRWTGFDGDKLVFSTPEGPISLAFDAVVLALGGASWPRLGSDGSWAEVLQARGVAVSAFRPSNCGFDVDWSPIFVERFAGAPVKGITADGVSGEFVVSATGIEGSLVYTLSAALRGRLSGHGRAQLTLDLAPGRTVERLAAELARQNRKASFANRLRKGGHMDGVKAGLVREFLPDAPNMSPEQLAKSLKSLALPVVRPRPIAEAISTAGGVAWDAVDENYMLRDIPGVFVAGEMLDWEAPTGGYLITGCLATGAAAAKGVGVWLG